jgi:hydrogenase expression/formation protein HypC
MCLAIPARIESVDGQRATVAVEGSRAEALLALVPQAKVGDWVLVHAGMAIAVLDPEQAMEAFELLKQAWTAAGAGGDDVR